MNFSHHFHFRLRLLVAERPLYEVQYTLQHPRSVLGFELAFLSVLLSSFPPLLESLRSLFPPLLVPLHVEGEVVGPGEAAVALAALEGLDARVLPQVPRQLVRPREPPLAAVPGAPVRLLT